MKGTGALCKTSRVLIAMKWTLLLRQRKRTAEREITTLANATSIIAKRSSKGSDFQQHSERSALKYLERHCLVTNIVESLLNVDAASCELHSKEKYGEEDIQTPSTRRNIKFFASDDNVH